MYYDKDHADNTDNIGAINTAAGAAVWDGNFEAVYHMVDDTTSTVLDSTSNNNDLSKKGANEPQGEINQQHFDGVDDYLTHATLLDVVPANGAISFYLKSDVDSGIVAARILHKASDFDVDHQDFIDIYWLADAAEGSRFIRIRKRYDQVTVILDSTTSITSASYFHITVGWGSDGCKLYINGILEDDDADTNSWNNGTEEDLFLGIYYDLTSPWDGIYRETRMSENTRLASWVKAEYNSLYDTLLTYGSEELGVNSIFFGMNF